MKSRNDYVNLARGWLRDRAKMEIAARNLEDELQTISDELASTATHIASYGDVQGGGTGELNGTEAMAERRIDLGHRMKLAEANPNEIRRILGKLERAMQGLNKDEVEILEARHVARQSWDRIAQTLFCSERNARYKEARAAYALSYMLFGVKSRPKQLSFVFAD